MSLDRMIKNAVRCTICGAGFGQCDCWSRCGCGWLYRKGEACRNPSHGTGGDIYDALEIVAMAAPRRGRKQKKTDSR